MIVDVPTADDFNVSGTDFLNIAWGMVTDLSLSLLERPKFWTDDFDVVADYYWKAAQRPLATALSLVQQGTEFLLKGHIAAVSPYLLLSKDSGIWSTKSYKSEVRFSEFKTIEAQDLIKAYNTIKSTRLPDDFQARYESLRSRRNTIMHTVDPKLYIKPRDLFVEVLEVCHHLISPKSWMETRRTFIDSVPRSLIDDSEPIFGDLLVEINYVVDLLEPAEVNRYFGFTKKQRCYICPECYEEVNDYFQDLDTSMPKLAQLQPNKPSTGSLYCFVCNQLSNVRREHCKNCVGNVISVKHNLCLTCANHQHI